MRKETDKSTIDLVEALPDGEWAVRWDIKPKLDGQGTETGVYWYEEAIFNHIPQMDEVGQLITEWYNKQTDSSIMYGFEWSGHKVLLNEENKFNFKSLFDLAVMMQPQIAAWDAANPDLAGKDYIEHESTDAEGNLIRIPEPTGRPKSVLPLTLKLGTNDVPEFYTFTTLDELTEFYLSAAIWTQNCYAAGWYKLGAFDYAPYKDAISKL